MVLGVWLWESIEEMIGIKLSEMISESLFVLAFIFTLI